MLSACSEKKAIKVPITAYNTESNSVQKDLNFEQGVVKN